MKKRKKGNAGKIIRTVLSGVFTVILIVIMIAANTALAANDRMINSILGDTQKRIDNSKSNITGVDFEYNKADYTANEIKAAEENLKNRISEEGLVLLKNDEQTLPIKENTTFSIFSANSASLSIGGGLLGGGSSLKEVFEQNQLTINETLWKFYQEGPGKEYGLASGSVGFGDAEDFRIQECPLSVLQENEVLASVQGTTPIYVLKRVAGEGRDMPRSMYNHAESQEDKEKSYLEPDSTELEILKYLNDNFDNTILVVNSNAALELDWISEFPNIKSIIYAPDGLLALPGVLTGKINPSGRTVDTFAADALASPAAQNFGDYAYYNEDGTATKYNYVSYAEGIYVGYKYYETRYEDVVLGQGNAGEYDYATEVCYPFGYGLSYTEFAWDNFQTVWSGSTCTVTVDVTNTGDMSGKDVVEIYAQSPYTEYDVENQIEKPAVQLVGYEKTSELAPGETETLHITFDEEQLKAYDENGAKTYILDAGTYYITAGKNAHDAINNVLAAKGADSAAMTAEGNVALTAVYEPAIEATDVTTYATDSYSGVEITNQFDDAKGDITYLSRSNWEETFPKHDGEASEDISTWGNEINGTDAAGNPASYTYGKTISSELLAALDSFESGNPQEDIVFEGEIVYGEDNGLNLIHMRGLDFDDPLWEKLLDELTEEDYNLMIEQSGYGTPFLDSINKPFCVDADTAAGLIYGGTKAMFPNPMTMAQTWNQTLALEYGTMIGNEALLGGADGWYAPSMNIHRTPFSGRNGEYYSEDAFLSGLVASNEVYGAASKGVYTYIKHFAFNDQENHRGDREGQYSIATWLNEQSAREIYLLPFEMCMKVGDVTLNYVRQNKDGTYENASRDIRACQAIMTGFNRIGTTWTGGSFALITGIVRNEWAFNGFIITDNANTGVFMVSDQMTAAGADGKLTYGSNSVRMDFDGNDAEDYYYGRQAMHRMLYTIVNSKAMNGLSPEGEFVHAKTLVEKVILGVNTVCLLLILLMVVLTIRRFRKKPIVE